MYAVLGGLTRVLVSRTQPSLQAEVIGTDSWGTRRRLIAGQTIRLGVLRKSTTADEVLGGGFKTQRCARGRLRAARHLGPDEWPKSVVVWWHGWAPHSTPPGPRKGRASRRPNKERCGSLAGPVVSVLQTALSAAGLRNPYINRGGVQSPRRTRALSAGHREHQGAFGQAADFQLPAPASASMDPSTTCAPGPYGNSPRTESAISAFDPPGACAFDGSRASFYGTR